MPPRHQISPPPDPSQLDQIAAPAFRAPAPPPGPWNPDPAPAGDGSASASSGASPAPTLTPAELAAAAKGKGKAYAKIAGALLHAIGGYVNMLVAVDADDKAFLPDDDDDETIPPPVGRIAARKIKLGADAENLTDFEDMAMAAIGLAAWAAKGITEHLTARRERGPKGKRQKPGAPVYDGTGEAGGQPGMEQMQ